MSTKKIMVVEDNKILRNALKFNLEENKYIVVTADDGEEAVEKAYSENPDLIILDLVLPKLDGYMVCSLLKKDKRYSSIPIIILTARDKKEVLKMSGKVGADAYMIKPFKSKILRDKIKKLIAKAKK
jgi:DNA-binding response OmpR family regulator